MQRNPNLPLHKLTHTRINLYVDRALWRKFTEDCEVLKDSPSTIFQNTMRRYIRENAPCVLAELQKRLEQSKKGMS